MTIGKELFKKIKPRRPSVNSERNSIKNTRKVVYLGLLIALTIILRRYLNFHIKLITFGGFPIILSGIMFGPISGACVGGMSDIMGYLISSFGKPYHPGFTFTAALNGLIPAIILILMREKMENPSFRSLTIAIFAGQFITGVILVPYFYSQIFGVPYFYIKIIEGFLTLLVHSPLYAFIIIKILKVYYSGKHNSVI